MSETDRMVRTPMTRPLKLILLGVAALAILCLGFLALRPTTPLKSEFYRDKRGAVYFKVWISDADALPYDDFTWKITKIQAPDGQRFSFSYPMSKDLLLKGMFLNSHAWGGVNPYGSDCHAGDRFILEIPRCAPLVLDAPDSTKGLKLVPYDN